MSSLSSQSQERPVITDSYTQQLDTSTLNGFLRQHKLDPVYGVAIRAGGCETDANFRDLCNCTPEGITTFVNALQLNPFQKTILIEKLKGPVGKYFKLS